MDHVTLLAIYNNLCNTQRNSDAGKQYLNGIIAPFLNKWNNIIVVNFKKNILFQCVLLRYTLLKGVLTSYISISTGEREVLCAGKEFRLPVYSTSRTVMFTPESGEPKRVLLENTSVSEILLLLSVFFADAVHE